MPIIGTAGHVDHGKSTLVLALTGRDPDRWDEEKRRGLTIDLGFAWAELEPGLEVAFVDVPGHQRFIKNMLAGAGAIDAALFVVAADEGWMPQSEEHMSVLELLGVRTGVIAVSRSDLAGDLLPLAVAEVEEQVADTGLAGWPILPVSAVTGEGVEALKAALADAVRSGPDLDDDGGGRPRLWVDRSFVIHGAGTVVTGTLIGGGLAQGDEVEVLPGGDRARIRSIQSHEREVDVVPAGSRAALNLAGLRTADVPRGSLLVLPGTLRTTRRFVADVTPVRALEEPLGPRGAYHLHLGSGSTPVRLRFLEGKELVGTRAVILTPDTPVPVAIGDRFILRETGRRLVAAGGVILDPRPARTPGPDEIVRLREGLDEPPDVRAAILLDLRGEDRLAALAADTGGGAPDAAVVRDGIAVAARTVEEVAAGARSAVAEFHDRNPLRPGHPSSTLASSLGVPQSVLEAVLAGLDDLTVDGAVIRSTSFLADFPEDDAAWTAAREMLTESLAVPRASQLGLEQELFHAAVRTGRLVSIAPDLVYLPEQIEEMTGRLGELPEEFVVGDFRDLFGLTRRQSVPLLEWLDTEGWTERRGDLRTVRRRG